MRIDSFISNKNSILSSDTAPWQILNHVKRRIEELIAQLSTEDYQIEDNIAIHRSAEVEPNVIIKPFTIISESVVIKSGSYLREGVYLGKSVVIGTNCEIKQSIIFDTSRIAHLNYVGNSIIGEDVNIEAGAVLANHFNEREDKRICVLVNDQIIDTKVTKFGSVIGDGSRIGANAVLSPGTVLRPGSIVERLQLIDQMASR